MELTYEEAVEELGRKIPYMIEFWVHAALSRLGFEYRDRVVNEHGGRAIISVDGLANSSTGHWVYYVNGIRSPYHINTQTSEGVRSIRFAFTAHETE